MSQIVRVIIPAMNEEKSISRVVGDIPKFVEEVIVVDNNSKDNTASVARKSGATVLSESEPGYGAACLKGMKYLTTLSTQTDVVVFLDGDYADYPDQLPEVIQPIIQQDVDFVIGSRALGVSEKGSLTPVQVFGNWLATSLLRIFYGVNFTDLGPFRAIKWSKLQDLGMKDRNYGWTVEMQLRVAQMKLSYTEVPVRYRNRIGTSKVSGTIKGSIFAGYKILFTIFRYL